MRRATGPVTIFFLRKFRICFRDFELRRCLPKETRRKTLPVPVILNLRVTDFRDLAFVDIKTEVGGKPERVLYYERYHFAKTIVFLPG